MAKIKLKIQGTTYLQGVKTFANTLVGLKSVKQLKFFTASLILGFSIIGCSDVPYTGPILSVDNVDRYLSSTGEDKICLQDGFDTICLKYTQVEGTVKDGADFIYIHPTSVAYLFYFEDLPILQAEKAMDTTQLVQTLVDSGKVQLPPNRDTSSAGNIDKGWTIQIYYPTSFPEAKRGVTPQTSGLDIRIAEGMKIRIHTRDEMELKNFAQINGVGGTRGVQFSVDTEHTEITIHVDGLISGYTAKFYVNGNDVVSDEDNSTFELGLLQ